MARRGAYRRRPGGEWRPTGQQRRVLDLLAQGKTNAEIALALGITPDGAKWHVGQLLRETGLEDRRALADWWRREKERRQGARLPAFAWTSRGRAWLFAGALTAAGLALLFADLLGTTTDSPAALGSVPHAVISLEPRSTASAPSPTPWPDEDVKALAAQMQPPSSCEPPAQQDFRIVSSQELESQGLIAVGKLAFTGHCPLYVANRADRALAWLGGGGYLRVDSGQSYVLGLCCAHARFHLGGEDYALTIYSPYPAAGDLPAGLKAIGPGLLEVQRDGHEGGYVMLEVRKQVEASPGPVSLGSDHRAALSSDGYLFLDIRPLPDSLARNSLTGEAIPLSGLRRIGTLPLLRREAGGASYDVPIRNDCYERDGRACSIQYDAGGAIPSPVAGLLKCRAGNGETYHELDAGDLVLRLDAFGGYKFEGDCVDRPISSGEPLPHATFFSIEASYSDGLRLSLVVTRGGDVYAGEYRPRLGCPCEPRN